MAKKDKPKVSDKDVKKIWANHKPANRNETYGKDNIVIVKRGKKKKSK